MESSDQDCHRSVQQAQQHQLFDMSTSAKVAPIRRSCSRVRKKRVAFSTIEIRSYPIILGDNPSVSEGAPIAIDWCHQDEKKIKVDNYEIVRPRRRSKEDLVLQWSIREHLLVQSGFTAPDIRSVIEQVRETRSLREATSKECMAFSVMGERMVKFVRRTLNSSFRRQKQQEKIFVKQFSRCRGAALAA